MGNPEVRLVVPGARVDDVRPMGEEERHARFTLRGGPGQIRGVAFGVGGTLAKRAAQGPADASVRLELNEWNGATEPRAVLGTLYEPAEAPAERCMARQRRRVGGAPRRSARRAGAKFRDARRRTSVTYPYGGSSRTFDHGKARGGGSPLGFGARGRWGARVEWRARPRSVCGCDLAARNRRERRSPWALRRHPRDDRRGARLPLRR